MDILAGLIQTAFLAGGVLALAAMGEVLAERVGVVNLGVEGLMALGAVTAIATVITTPVPVLGLAAALAVGLFAGMLFATATVVVRANQVLAGLALTLIGTGLAATVGRAYSGTPAPATFQPLDIPVLSDIPFLGRALFSHNILVYVIFLVLPLFLHWLMFRTRHGLTMRAVGEAWATMASLTRSSTSSTVAAWMALSALRVSSSGSPGPAPTSVQLPPVPRCGGVVGGVVEGVGRVMGMSPKQFDQQRARCVPPAA